MTLSFSTHIDGKPTHFVEKIWRGLLAQGIDLDEFLGFYEKQLLCRSILPRYPKLHTIRADEKDRWKAGRKIHFVINNRTANRLQFAPVVLCKSVKRIAIKPNFRQVTILREWDHTTDLSPSEIAQLAINDGFDSMKSFWDFFSEDFNGKIIHWTGHWY